MRQLLFILISSCVITLSALAQVPDLVNKIDESGKKQGYWIKHYENGNVQYQGFFNNDNPIGEFKRYYEDSQLRSIQVFSSDGKETDVTIYHRNGFLASTGKYIDQKKEGKWKTYSENIEGYLISEEEYSADKRNGLSVKYYPSGSILEKLSYLNDLKNGEWTQFYPDSSVAISSAYSVDKLNGPFEVFYPDGKKEYTGQYKNNTRDGVWHLYKEDGTLRYEIVYNNGIINNTEMLQIESDYLDSLDKNKGKIDEPDISDIQW